MLVQKRVGTGIDSWLLYRNAYKNTDETHVDYSLVTFKKNLHLSTMADEIFTLLCCNFYYVGLLNFKSVHLQ